MPLLVVHPWELSDRPCPGLLTGLARFLHDAGRTGYRDKFRTLLAAMPWGTIDGGLRSALASARGEATTESTIGNRPVELGPGAAVS
jgi:hypothetical protein